MKLNSHLLNATLAKRRARIFQRLLFLFAGTAISIPCATATEPPFYQVGALQSPEGGDQGFGGAIAIEGDLAVVGATGRPSSGVGADERGAVFVFERNSVGTWELHSKLVASDALEGDWFGRSLSIDGPHLLIGATRRDDNGTDSGAAYVFQQSGSGEWLETAKLLPSDGAASDSFGESVSISGSVALVGAYRADVGQPNAGAAYLFERNDQEEWVEVKKLVAPVPNEDSNFGVTVAISGNLALVGAPQRNVGPAGLEGAVYTYRRNGEGEWRLNAILEAPVPPDPRFPQGFGSSVAADGERLAIGAADRVSGRHGLYVFEPDGTGGWDGSLKLDATHGDYRFGRSVAIDGDVIAIGDERLAHTFERSESDAWEETRTLTPPELESRGFGSSVALSGDTLLVNSTALEKVFVYERSQAYRDWITPFGVTDERASADPDGDCILNETEWEIGTDPSSPNRPFQMVRTFGIDATTYVLAYDTVSGRLVGSAGRRLGITEFDTNGRLVRSYALDDPVADTQSGIDVLANGNLLVSDYRRNNHYFEIDRNGRTVSRGIRIADSILSDGPLAVHPSGQSFFGSPSSQEIAEITRTGAILRQFGTGRYVYDLAYNPTTGNLYATDGHTLTEWTPDGDRVVSVDLEKAFGLTDAEGVTFDPINELLYVSDGDFPLTVLVLALGELIPTDSPPETREFGPINDLGELLAGDTGNGSLQVIDLDGDGGLDIALNNGAGNSDEVYLNDGTGNFPTDAAHRLAIGRDASNSPIENDAFAALAFCDVDRDGDLDAIVENDDQLYVSLYDKPNGTFTRGGNIGPVLNSSTYDIACGDLNGDGWPDLVTAQSSAAPGDMIYFNLGDGTFENEPLLVNTTGTFGTQTSRAVALGDVDGDGDLDIAIGVSSSAQNWVFLNDGSGGFSDTSRVPFGTGEDRPFYSSVIFADIDGINGVDLVVGNLDQQNAVYLNDGNGNFDQELTLGVPNDYTSQIAVGDLNGDGLPDVAVGNRWIGSREGARTQSLVYYNHADPALRFTEATPFGDHLQRTTSIALGDIDGNGQLDIIQGVDDSTNGIQRNRIYLNPGGATTNQPPSVAILAPGEGAGSLLGVPVTLQGSATDPEDGDLGPSLVWYSSLDGRLGTGPELSTTELRLGTHLITANVLDSGAKPAGASIEITVMEWSPSIVHTVIDPNFEVALGNSVAALGDVDGDGIPDFAVSGYELASDFGLVRIVSGSNNQVIRSYNSSEVGVVMGETRNLEGVGDLNGDGVSELAVTSWGNKAEVLVFDIASGTTVRIHTGSGVFPDELFGTEIASLGDLDADGVPDYAILTENVVGGEVIVYSGKDGEELATIASNAAFPISIAGAGDLDGDGVPELALGIWDETAGLIAGELRVLSGQALVDQSPDAALDYPSPEVDAATLWAILGEMESDLIPVGFGINQLDDLDGDGVPDIATGSGLFDDLTVLSGIDGSRLHLWDSPVFHEVLDQLVVEAETIGDVDGDGVSDVVIGRMGRLTLRSGRTGILLHEMPSPPEYGEFLGEEIAAIGDLNGDGISEILAGDPIGGYALVISFAPDGLSQPQPPFIEINRGGSGVEIRFGGILQRSSDLLDWVDLDPQPVSPWRIPPNGEAEYFRARRGPSDSG